MIDFSDFASAEKVFRFFEEISKIPRGSGKTDLIAEYLVDFAKKRNLEVIRDEYDNVIIKKPATKGYENKPTVILQGHTDIVAVKTADSDIDLNNDGLDIYRDGDFLRAKNTSLGGDDGVAVAYALAILDSDDIPHPSLETVFTTDEEVGLTGATGLGCSNLNGSLLINIDSDDEGVFTVGCAGGARVDVSLSAEVEKLNGMICRLSVDGLLGGHSGVEIDKGRVNAIKLLAALLSELKDVRLISLNAGTADNAIAKDAFAIFTTASSSIDVSRVMNKAKSELPTGDPHASFDFSSDIGAANAIGVDDSNRILSLINKLPNGIINMMEDIPDLVETSLNMGILRLDNGDFCLSISVRSAKGVEKKKLIDTITKVSNEHGAAVSVRGAYPAWEYKKDSHLRDVMCRVYEKMYSKKPKVVTIHAGLECGIFSDKMPHLDCVSMGPDNYDIHTTNEHLSISSTARVYGYLLEVLKNI